MNPDNTDYFRGLLTEHPPAFLDRVNTPWDTVPDLLEFNGQAFNRIQRALTGLARQDAGRLEGNTQGILILGEAGTGKTHLLMRVAKHLAKTNRILFVRKPNNEEAVAQHVWKNIVDSLARKLSTEAGARSQLDDMLAHVFSAVLIPEFQEDIRNKTDVEQRQRWVDRLTADPYQLFEMLGEGQRRSDNLELIRRRTLRYLRANHPDVDQVIAQVLITYCLVAKEEHKRILINWLAGVDVEENDARSLGLPPGWIAVTEESNETGVAQQREEIALRAIRTVGILAQHYQPLILAFDQLEGLRGEHELTSRWADVVREIFTMAPNFLIITCIFPSLWDTWFKTTLDRSVIERIAQQRIELEPFSSEHATRMLATHLDSTFRRFGLPTNIYPFTPADLQRLVQDSTSPRTFLQAAKASFEAWLDRGLVEATPRGDATDELLTTEAIERVLGEALDRFEKETREEGGPAELLDHELFGQLRSLVEALLRSQGIAIEVSKASYRNLVMPPNIIIAHRLTGTKACLATMNSEGNSIAARIRNLNHCFSSGEFQTLIMIRDRRCRPIGTRTKKHIEEAEARGAVFVDAGRHELSQLDALYSTLVAIEERDLTVGKHLVDKAHFSTFLRTSKRLLQSEFFREFATRCPPFSEIVGLSSGRSGGASAATGGSTPQAVPTTRLPVESRKVASESQREGVVLVDDPTFGVGPEDVGRNPEVARRSEVEWRIGEPAIVDLVIGATDIHQAHVGLVGQLAGDGSRLGISLAKPQCLVLLGYMGSGKSYALGVLIENALLRCGGLIRQERPMAVVAFNYRRNSESRFEYGGYAVPNNREPEVRTLREQYGVEPDRVARVNVLAYREEIPRRVAEYANCIPFPIEFRSDELTAEHWRILMRPPSREAEYMDIIRDIIQVLSYAGRLTLENLDAGIRDDQRFTPTQRRRAMNRLSFAERWISDDRQYEWTDLIKEGSLTVVDLRMLALESSEALKICLIVTDMIRRKATGINRVVVFDEAHEYVDSRELVVELENCITQIRHDGMTFILASQFPEKIPPQIFKYLATRFIFKLPNTRAVSYVRSAAPNLQSLVPEEVANLDLEAGQCYLQTDDDASDRRLRMPVKVRVRPRLTQHGGATVRQAVEPNSGDER